MKKRNFQTVFMLLLILLCGTNIACGNQKTSQDTPEEKTDEAVSIINDAVVLRNELFERVNSKEIESPKKHYKAISQDLLKGVDALFIRISGLTK